MSLSPRWVITQKNMVPAGIRTEDNRMSFHVNHPILYVLVGAIIALVM